MSVTSPRLRTISFGDLDGAVWGAALDAGGPSIVFATPDGTGAAAGPDAVRWSEADGGWTLAGRGFELSIAVTRAGEPGPTPDAAPAGVMTDDLCHVSGTLTVAGAEHRVQCVGTCSVADGVDPRRLDSVRGVSGWFADQQAVSLLALRPADRSSQERDVVGATLFDLEGRVAVNEPRLSTTYSHGTPTRTNLELWIGEGEEQFPRRAGGEARGPGAEAGSDGFTLQVTPLRCRAGGLDGAGVYLLARF